MLESYSEAVEKQMQEFHRRLPEKNRRLYAGIEALKLPRGGISYIADLFGCSRVTVRCGIKELGDEETLSQSRNRKIGGGRLSVLEKYPAINDVFLDLIKGHTAGDPMDEKIKWTDLTRAEISILLEKRGFKVSRNIVRKLLKEHDYVKRKALKKKRQENL